MLVRKLFKFAYPVAATLDIIASQQALNSCTLNYKGKYYFSQKQKKTGKDLRESALKSDKNDNSDSDSELSSDEDADLAQVSLNDMNPLTPKREDKLHQEDLLDKEPFQIISSPDAERITIQTTYGKAILLNPTLNNSKINAFKTVHYVNDQVSISYIRSILKNDPKGLIVFDPSTHYVNMFGLYNGIKRRVLKSFYGSAKKPKNPFKNCKTEKEYFDLHRRILIQQKFILARLCIMIDHKGDLRVKGDTHEAIPSSNTLKAKVKEISDSESQESSMYKKEFIVPVSYWLGLNTSDQWEKKGISIDMLDGKKIYPQYSVWPPTSQNYLTLFGEYVESNKNFLKNRKNTLDIGCGTGVLSFVLHRKCGGVSDIYAIDANKRAVECTKVNANILNLQDTIRVEKLDLVDTIAKSKVEAALSSINMPSRYELIISNPPWIMASNLSSEHELDNGVYDPKGSFLKSIIKFAGAHLTTQTMITKKGILVLVYSDLSEKLGLQPPNYIDELCKENNLIISKTISKPYFPADFVKKDSVDPLYRHKKASKVILYEITRP